MSEKHNTLSHFSVSRIRRLIPVAVASVLAVSFMAGYLAGVPGGVPSAYAACGTVRTCAFDGTVTSALQVTHVTTDPGVVVVEPDNGETWSIQATWAVPSGINFACPCTSASATVTADVTWTGSGWNVTCTGCAAGGIEAVSICDAGSCGGLTHGWAYKLIVDVADSIAINCFFGTDLGFVTSVAYTTTSVDDGDIIDSCAETQAVSPTSQTFNATDNGSFECTYDCNQSGAATSIFYQ